MEGKILVAYGSVHGSTKEIAEVIGAILREQGFAVEVLPAREVKSLEGYSGVILGGSLYIFRWNKDALRFLNRHRNKISGGLPVAIFASGPFGESKPEDWQEVRTRFEQDLAKLAWLAPVSIEVIGGKFDPAHLRFPWNLIPALKQMPPSDLRDWAAIRAWALSLTGRLTPAAAAA